MATTTVRQDKDANAKLRYVFDWDAFVTGEGETVASAQVISPAGIGVASTTITASTVTITVSGGSEGTTYNIVNRITTSGGQREDKALQLTIVQVPSATHSIDVETGSGSSTANAYISVADGNSYHASHLHGTTWTQAQDATKEKAIIWATRLLDENFIWHGVKQSDSQALQWPRTNVTDRGGYAIDSDEVPTDLKNATAELARFLIASDRTAEDDTLGFSRIRVGPVDLSIDKIDRKPIIPSHISRMLSALGEPANAGVLRLMRA